MSKIIILTGLLITICFQSYSQLTLDRILYNLNNKKLAINPALVNPWQFRNSSITKDSTRKGTIILTVETDYGNIGELVEIYSRPLVIYKLFDLLSDTTRDFYANALLSDLLDYKRLFRMNFVSRKEWEKKGWKNEDYEFFNKALFSDSMISCVQKSVARVKIQK